MARKECFATVKVNSARVLKSWSDDEAEQSFDQWLILQFGSEKMEMMKEAMPPRSVRDEGEPSHYCRTWSRPHQQFLPRGVPVDDGFGAQGL